MGERTRRDGQGEGEGEGKERAPMEEAAATRRVGCTRQRATASAFEVGVAEDRVAPRRKEAADGQRTK